MMFLIKGARTRNWHPDDDALRFCSDACANQKCDAPFTESEFAPHYFHELPREILLWTETDVVLAYTCWKCGHNWQTWMPTAVAIQHSADWRAELIELNRKELEAMNAETDADPELEEEPDNWCR